ncbi:MAG: hypothetical protein JSS22_09185, partial [Proteobacteria bacterium]|nr:hypothetical protein [Pseudomonadota bacterium]
EPLGLEVFDLGFFRWPRVEVPGMYVGQANTYDVLFCGPEIRARKPQPEVPVDRLIKFIIVCELYCLTDVAIDLLRQNKVALGAKIDVDKAEALLRASVPAD